VHTQRKNGDEWFVSAEGSVMPLYKSFPFTLLSWVVPFFSKHRSMTDALWDSISTRDGRKVSYDPDFPAGYKAAMIASYDANNARVRSVAPQHRIFIQDHKNGWGPLCNFLGKAVPDVPYPHVNSKADFQIFVRNITLMVSGVGSVIVLVASFVVVQLTTGGKAKKRRTE
jgi:hypothetical protein